ncbi:hypothetical protein EYZ11_003887 [Aspergillus tanneri]|uniref:ABC transporter domain-containing protein n=1 Tax=Aspergillus tanneri TaxID=1220188 RepID=A0A4S3JP92_9EURO|nr:hypothetical protein EYZ11_003887 [Aspergillus tanneri]
MVIVLVGITIGIRGSPTAGFLGVALNSVISFSLELAELVTSWTDLETAIQALSRIKSFTANTSAESNSEEESHLPENWPSGGQIEFKNVSASYKGSASAVLVDIDLLITSGQKIGVCGRTGSGKSSLLATLTRILDVDHGSILIDGIEIKYVPHQHIRSNILNIPQEPFIIPGTIRNNMDPWDKLPNCQLTDILRKVCLWENISTKAGLDTDMNDIHLSTGQLQLLSLARVLVQQGRIVVMDEISSNLDSETDVLIQSVINECLMGRTVIIVSHNLDRLMECEKVIVIESGRVVEFEAPTAKWT